jgi:S1-C subfamily serine protease
MNRKRIFPVAGAAALFAAVGIAAGCGGSAGGASPTVTPSGQLAVSPQQTVQSQLELSPSVRASGDPYELIPDIVEQVQPSIVSVIVRTGQGGAEGSGVVWDGSRGLIVTNNHVVEGGGQVEVRLSSGDQIAATVLATDPQTDLAVIKVDRTDLQTASFAKELPRVGELAVAMGNPLGFENSVTAGIVSALHRSLGEAPYNDLIQTDAPISPGNSGGALVNHDGDVIGINTAGIPTTQNANSLGFAIPSTTVSRVVEQLVESGRVSHPYLGVSTTDTGRGVVLQGVAAGSPAEAAGLQAGDAIVAVDGTEVTSTSELAAALASHAVGDQVTLTVERNGSQIQVTATLGERPPTA